jgi:hypothetical protein
MARALKLEATKPTGSNLLQQQERFYRFMEEYNHTRPHQGFEMKCPADLYERSPRKYEGLPTLTYPGHDKTLVSSKCGRASAPDEARSTSAELSPLKPWV